MPLPITTLYAALIALVFLVLSVRTIRYRRANGPSLGPGDDKHMLRFMRAHANCAEYAPIGLILLALCELGGLSAALLHVLGALLFLGRALHAYGLSGPRQVVNARVGGMVLTLLSIGAAALLALWLSFTTLA